MKNIFFTSFFSKCVLILMLILIFTKQHLYSQSVTAGCGTTAEHQKRVLSETQRKLYAAAQKKLLSYQSSGMASRMGAEDHVYTIPVVVHVIEPKVGKTIITDVDINQGLMNMNYAYRNMSAESDGTDARIQFQLAARSPEGTTTTGIRRVRADQLPDYVAGGAGSGGEPYENIRALDFWDNQLYYNIWVVTSLDQGQLSGMAAVPSGSHDISDGAIVDADLFLSKIIVHELGHGMGLVHTFAYKFLEGDTDASTCPPNNDCTTDGDGVCDTEPTNASANYLECTGGPVPVNPCTGATYGNVLKNYMSYAWDACTSQFTAGQVARMRSTLVALRPTLYDNLSLVTPPPLPVRLISFEAERSEQTKVLLRWKTSIETGHDHFDVESSKDGKKFQPVGQVKNPWRLASGVSEYLFTDPTPQGHSEVYYRLKQVDLDGSYAYSKIVAVDAPDGLSITVSPNPAGEMINISGVSDTWEVDLLTVGGTLIHTYKNQSKIDMNMLTPGQYIVRIKAHDGETINKKIVKK